MKIISAFLIGLIFGTGIILSGMANPAKIINFFDITGHWDPSLGFVMAGALFVTALGYRLVFKVPSPRLAEVFSLPTGNKIDKRLIGGSAVFGLGWGIAGFCPGGALPALGTLRSDVMIFVVAMALGIVIARLALRADGFGLFKVRT